MEKVIKQMLLRSRRMPLLVIAVALAILGLTILLARERLGSAVREQILGRDAYALYGVALMHQLELAEQDEALFSIADPDEQLTVVLKTSRLHGVLGARLFEADGAFVDAFPAYVAEAGLNPADLAALRDQKPVSRFHRSVPLPDLFLVLGTNAADRAVPLLEVNVPFHTREGEFVGAAQFIIEGQGIIAEFARLDRNLTIQSLAAFGVGGGILAAAIGWAFQRLRRAQRLLAERTNKLIDANQELALAAKTSAVGAITSHLIHGLKSPLFGLQSYVSRLGREDAARLQTDLQQVIATTRRMQSMINQIVGVLREEEGARSYQITLSELLGLVRQRVIVLAESRGVRLEFIQEAEAALPNRVANLIALILVNLTQNAIQATPEGKCVTLALAWEDEQLVFEVRDEGQGLPGSVRETLFFPCHSTKPDGSGIGLALSKQLANHLGAGLALKRNSPAGCAFALSVPGLLCLDKSMAPTAPK